MELFTLITSSLGGVIGVVKNLLELRLSIKDLFRETVKLNKAFSELDKKDSTPLIKIYEAVEMGKEQSKRIYQKICIRYITLLLIVFLLIISVVYLVDFSLFRNKTILYAGLFLANYLLFGRVFGIPIQTSGNNFLFDIGEKIKNQAKEIDQKLYRIKRLFGTNLFLTPSEKNYLNRYFELCALRNSLEIYWISKKIEDAKTYLNETPVYINTIEETLIDILENYLRQGKSVNEYRNEISKKIEESGLGRFLEIFQDRFFNDDFDVQYKNTGRHGIKNVINRYWPV